MRMYSCTSSAAFLSGFSMRGSTRASGPPQTQVRGPQAFDLVAERRRLLEIQIRGRRPHIGLQAREVGIELGLGAESFRSLRGHGGRHVIALVHARHDL